MNRFAEFERRSRTVDADQAYAEAVDRLLASPHFGERLAVYWLDLVRYADSVGYHGDQDVSISPYRDYVIDAFNSNMPFDQFTREQLAGDLIENHTEIQKIASGYNRLGMMSAEGGVQPEEYLNKYASDRVRTTAAVWLGVTLGCAECHDHKFDPFTTKEFYEFSAFFADITEQGHYGGPEALVKWGPYIRVANDGLADLLKPIDAEIAKLELTVVENDEVRVERVDWEKAISTNVPVWESLLPESIHSIESVTFTTNDDRSILASGKSPAKECYLVTAKIDPNAKAIRLEALTDDSLSQKGPGRAGNGNFVLSEFVVLKGDHSDQIEILQKPFSEWSDELKKQSIELENATATIEQADNRTVGHPDHKWSAASTIDHDAHGSTWGWAILPGIGQSQELVIQVKPGAELTETVTFVIQQYHEAANHTLGRFRISQSQSKDAVADQIRRLPSTIQTIIRLDPDDRTEDQRNQIRVHYLSIAPRYADANRRIAELRTQRANVTEANTTITLITVATKPRERRVLARGDWMDKSGEIVQPGILKSVSDINWDTTNRPDGRANRMDLANWILGPENPLTARVFVNRSWRMLFGNGLSNSLDDFGSQGEPPSHPELLDRLAIEFVESGWNVKQLVRTMVMSQAYRQSSRIRKELSDVDPENRLLARQARFRLDAEFIRDHALSVSGLLNRTVGGASTMPYQPAGLYRHLNFPTRTYKPSVGLDQYRRGLYTHWQRQFLHPAMKTFDAPAREECTAARPRSNTPLAALVMLNDPSYVESARLLAGIAVASEVEVGPRIDVVFQRAFTRIPTEEEKSVIVSLLESQLDYYRDHLDEANELIKIGQDSAELDGDHPVTAAELAAWTSVCRAVMNMHEFILRK